MLVPPLVIGVPPTLLWTPFGCGSGFETEVGMANERMHELFNDPTQGQSQTYGKPSLLSPSYTTKLIAVTASYHYSTQSSNQSHSSSHSPPPISYDRYLEHNLNGQLDYHQDQDSANEQDQALDEEPLYVNAKQYHRILKRRAARARLEELGRLSRQRKVSSYYICYLLVHTDL
jgi:hypothetical protein